MSQNTTKPRRLPPAALASFIALALVALAYGMASSCSDDEPEPRVIRAHTRVVGGISHAEPLTSPERYCVRCHGTALGGGPAGEPSCYTCHGKTWTQDAESAVDSPAPGDHTVDKLGFRHHPALATPAGTCDACHGTELQGQAEIGIPGCQLCHADVWSQP